MPTMERLSFHVTALGYKKAVKFRKPIKLNTQTVNSFTYIRSSPLLLRRTVTLDFDKAVGRGVVVHPNGSVVVDEHQSCGE